MTPEETAHKWKVVGAFAVVYIIWGSTYLGIRFALETMPPFTMASARFLIAGALMFAWCRRQGAPIPTAANWKSAAVVGTLLLAGGNGLLVFAEQTVASSLAALIITTVPLWMVAMDWIRPGGRRPKLSVMLGLGGGLAGVAYLINPGAEAGSPTIPLIGGVLLLLAALSWAAGSMVAKTANLPTSPLMSTATQMLAGGATLAFIAVFAGEASHLHPSAVSLRSFLAFLYLVFFGAIGGYTAYIWLLKNVETAKVATYAYVNPVVAVLLGWTFADEQLTGRTLVAAGIIIASVGLITTTKAKPPLPRTRP